MSSLVRFILIGVIVIIAGGGFALFQTGFFNSEEVVVDAVIDKVPEERIIEDRTKKKTKASPKNAAAEGLSNFYASLNADMDSDGPVIKNNIVYLPDPKGDLVQQLEAIRMVTRSLSSTWRGTVSSRAFRSGETLFQNLTKYSKEDGIEIIWWLNRDFVVKEPFRINKSTLKTAYLVGKAVEGHFYNGINIYFCNQHRVIVLIDQEEPYLTKECILLTSATR